MNKNKPSWFRYVSAEIISECKEKFSKQEKEKFFDLPDYKTTRHNQGPNIYHPETSANDLKDEDFIKAATEYKNNTSKNEKEKFNGKSIWLWIAGITLILGFIIAMIYVAKRTKKKK